MSENIGFTDSKDHSVFTVKRRRSTPLFDLHANVRVQILTHEPMPVCSFEHNFPLNTVLRLGRGGRCLGDLVDQ